MNATDRRRLPKVVGMAPTPSLPCDRCGTVQPLYRHGHELLCLVCFPGVRGQR